MFVDTYSWAWVMSAFYVGAVIGFCSGLALFACWLANGQDDTDEAEAATRAIEQWRAKHVNIVQAWEKGSKRTDTEVV
jgi:hypothetical protein